MTISSIMMMQDIGHQISSYFDVCNQDAVIKHGFHETCYSVKFYFMKKKTPNNAVTPQCQSQFTPKMKANANPRLLSSLVRIDSGLVVSQHRLESFFMK